MVQTFESLQFMRLLLYVSFNKERGFRWAHYDAKSAQRNVFQYSILLARYRHSFVV